eukprot:1509537-Rhodomonas_salina.2
MPAGLYAMSGTEIGHAGGDQREHTEADGGGRARSPLARSCPLPAYAPPTQCPVLTWYFLRHARY